MKLKHVGMIVVSVLAMSSAAVSAAEGDESVTTTVNGGVIHFKGEVVNAACAIDSESMNQTVELGQVRSSRLAKAGDLSSAVGFNIKLNDCDTNVSSNAAVAFLGTTVTSNDDTLALQSSAAGSAQNVGIQSDTMVLVKAPGADNVKIENQTGIHTDWRGYAILPFATEYRENRVALNANSLADNVELDETVLTVIPTHGAIARATFNAQIGGKVLMTLKYGNKSVPFGAIVTHGENKNGSIVAENGQVYLTGLPQSGKLQVSWGKDKNSNCIVEYKLPEVSPGTLLNQQTAICR